MRRPKKPVAPKTVTVRLVILVQPDRNSTGWSAPPRPHARAKGFLLGFMSDREDRSHLLFERSGRSNNRCQPFPSRVRRCAFHNAGMSAPRHELRTRNYRTCALCRSSQPETPCRSHCRRFRMSPFFPPSRRAGVRARTALAQPGALNCRRRDFLLQSSGDLRMLAALSLLLMTVSSR